MNKLILALVLTIATGCTVNVTNPKIDSKVDANANLSGNNLQAQLPQAVVTAEPLAAQPIPAMTTSPVGWSPAPMATETPRQRTGILAITGILANDATLGTPGDFTAVLTGPIEDGQQRRTARADASGRFYFELLPKGDYLLSFTKEGDGGTYFFDPDGGTGQWAFHLEADSKRDQVTRLTTNVFIHSKKK